MDLKQTSENVRDADRNFFLLANIIADTASLELVAKGRAMNDMKKEGMLVALEKLSTASTRGSANAAAITAPSNNSSTAFMVVHWGFSTPSTTSSLWSPKRKWSLFVCCKCTQRHGNLSYTGRLDLLREWRQSATYLMIARKVLNCFTTSTVLRRTL